VKTLTLLRHAKSSWDDPIQRDFDRPLNAKGLRAARRVGQHLRDQGAHFDHVVASPAVRVIETLDGIWEGYGRTLKPVWDRRIYLASAATLLEVVHDVPAEADSVLLVGHNPGLEDLVLILTPDDGDATRDTLEEKFPTAAVAVLGFKGAWPDLAPRGARLTKFTRPRDLDASLGPDAV
jgi:phosphohistidine phosphatase